MKGFRIRGLGGKRVNVIIDGVRIPDSYVGYGRDVVDVDLVKKVEILKIWKGLFLCLNRIFWSY